MEQQRNRIIVLSSPFVWNKNTCATIIESGLDVVGICMLKPQLAGIPFNFILKSVKRRRLSKVVGQILGRVYYNVLNKRKDTEIQRRLFDEARIESVLKEWERAGGEIHGTESYSSPDTLDWLKSKKPDLFVVHTGGWVGKKVREIPSKKIVIGGHPGLTPHYRGAHSAFWAIYKGRPQDVGWSVFWVDKGVDTGDLVAQDTLEIEEGDSYVTLGWKGMIKEAEAQAQAIINYENGAEIPRRPHSAIPPDSEFHVPTLFEYLRYRHRQKQVR